MGLFVFVYYLYQAMVSCIFLIDITFLLGLILSNIIKCMSILWISR